MWSAALYTCLPWLLSKYNINIENCSFSMGVSWSHLPHVRTHMAQSGRPATFVGRTESNGSLPSCLWFTSPVRWLARTGISSGTLRSVIEDGLPFLSTAVARSSSGSVATRYVGLLPLPWMTSYFANNRPYEGMRMLLQRVTSLRRCAQANAHAALY